MGVGGNPAGLCQSTSHSSLCKQMVYEMKFASHLLYSTSVSVQVSLSGFVRLHRKMLMFLPFGEQEFPVMLSCVNIFITWHFCSKDGQL